METVRFPNSVLVKVTVSSTLISPLAVLVSSLPTLVTKSSSLVSVTVYRVPTGRPLMVMDSPPHRVKVPPLVMVPVVPSLFLVE